MQPTGTLRLGCHPSFRMSLGRSLGPFLASNRHVKVELALTNSPTALLEDGLDVVLRIGRIAIFQLYSKATRLDLARHLRGTTLSRRASPAKAAVRFAGSSSGHSRATRRRAVHAIDLFKRRRAPDGHGACKLGGPRWSGAHRCGDRRSRHRADLRHCRVSSP